MPKQRRPETDHKIFVAGLEDHPDDLIISMAVMNRVVARAGEYGKLTRDALAAEVERRGLSPWSPSWRRSRSRWGRPRSRTRRWTPVERKGAGGPVRHSASMAG